MLEEHGLHLGAVHVLTAADDDVLEPVDDIDVALIVVVAEVPGMEPAVDEGCARGRGIIPVALGDLG